MARYDIAGLQYEDNAGNPLIAGKLYFYESGTTTAKATYSDIDETTANTNPVVLSASGRAPDIYFSGSAKIIILDSNDVQIGEPKDPVEAVGAGGANIALSAWNAISTYAFPRTVTASNNKFYQCDVASSQGQEPSATPASWTEVKFTGVWNTNKDYIIGDLALKDNVIYSALVPQSGNDPDGDATNWVNTAASIIPDQSGNAGKFLTTNGTDPSWGAGTGATDAQAAQITLNAFNIAVNGGLSVGNMIDGVVDTFTDATGTDTDVKQPAKSAGKYTLKTEKGFTLSDASYSTESFSVASQDTVPTKVVWNTDGTKFFIMGRTNDTVFEYTCSTGFDLSSTVAYSGESFSVTSQENQPQGLCFNNDGTKFFVVGQTNDTVYEYTCSVGFSLASTVAYSGRSFSVTSQENAPQGIDFSSDGLKFYIVGTQNDTVYEYTVPSAFTLTSAAYSGNSFSVASQETNPKDVTFSADGTSFFIAGSSGNDVVQYNVSVGFDLSSTVTYSGNSFSIASQEGGGEIGGVSFNADGTKFFIVGSANDTVFEYNVNGAQSSALTTADFTALAAPDSALVVLHQNPSTSITLNTNLQAWVSRTASKNFTTDPDTNNKLTVTANGYSNGQRVLLSQARANMIPAELNTYTAYFIVNVATDNFELSATSGGSTIALTAATDTNAGVLTLSVYSQAALALDAEQSAGSIVSGTADLSTQVSGTAIHTAIITPTQTAIDLFALSTQWS